MGKKKKGDKKDGGATALPPPPDFSINRQGALEAMLTYKIKGKEDVINLYSEEAEVFRDRNYQQKDKNMQIKHERSSHLQRLVQDAKEFEMKLDEAETITREDVEKAMIKKLELAKVTSSELIDKEREVGRINMILERVHTETAKLKKYKDEVQHEKTQYIELLQVTMQKWLEEEEELEGKLVSDLQDAKSRVDYRLSVLSEQQKEKISERLLQAMDPDAKGEIADNIWLKQQISVLKEVEINLQQEVNELEQRNLQLMEVLYKSHKSELEVSHKLFTIPRQHSELLFNSETNTQHTKFNSESRHPVQDKMHSSCHLDLGFLSVEGVRLNMQVAPDQVHLPPIEEQKHQGLPRTSWPITRKMLNTCFV